MLARRLRRRPNIKSALVQRIVFAGHVLSCYMLQFHFTSSISIVHAFIEG